MFIHQISIFVENKPGHLAHVLRTLADGGVNLVTLSLADTEQFGIVRLIVSDWEAAKARLEADERTVRMTEIVVAEVDDRPGGLAAVLEIIERAGVNVDYMYAISFGGGGKALMAFRFDRPKEALAVLAEGGVKVLSESEFQARAATRP